MISLHDKGNVHGGGIKEKKIPINNYVVEFTYIRGHIDINDIANMYKNDFYTILRKNITIIEEGEIKYDIWFEFKTKNEAINFISYCKTDFARMCLALGKQSPTTNLELRSIPWMDFNETWNDKKLYKHFNISKEEQDFIKEVIPAYYD